MTRIAPLAAAPLAAFWAALALSATAATPAAAEPIASNDPTVVVVTEQVRYPDLDLDKAAGARRLLDRIKLAADAVCGGRPGSGSGAGANEEYRICTEAAIAEAVARVDAPRLTALATGRRPAQALASR